MKISQVDYQDMKDLVDSGDLNLAAMRIKIFNKTGTETKLTDEQLTAASFTEDDDDDLLVANVQDIEANGLEITA